jgi:protein SCO1/2
MNRRRLILLIVSIVGLAVAAGLAWKLRTVAPAPVAQQQAVSVGGPFQLVDQDGRAVDESVLQGRWSAVFFGFTYCPDVCPTTLQALNAAADQLGGGAKDFQIVFISVDPARDTPGQMQAYLEGQNLRPGTLGLTGTPEQVAAVAKAYRVYFEKAGEGEGYTVNHTTTAYLMDPQGRFDRPLGYGMTPEQMADQISQAMRAK